MLQGADFASTPTSAIAWGSVIGMAAFFAWLSVDINDENDVLDDCEENTDSSIDDGLDKLKGE